ncbi:MAG: hypothetical protein A2007_01940 [Verrucomicrobia bacterium GWC2_42_7]|nr:MAG: hypothetical protein A2007_01940 [Verrucomicrobia bacterium GWC2_42_7]
MTPQENISSIFEQADEVSVRERTYVRDRTRMRSPTNSKLKITSFCAYLLYHMGASFRLFSLIGLISLIKFSIALVINNRKMLKNPFFSIF